MNKKEYISPALFFIESEEMCLRTASVLQDDVVIDTFPVVEDNPNDFKFDLPDNWGGD